MVEAFSPTSLIIVVAIYLSYRLVSAAMRPQLPGPRNLKYTNLQARIVDILITLSRGSSLLNKVHQRYGPVVQISRNEISINSAAALRDLYSVSRRLDRPGPLALFHNYQAENLVSTESGDVHQERRKPLRSIYSVSAVDSEETQVAIKTSVSRLLKHLNSCHEPIESRPVLRLFLYEVMSHVVYGKAHALDLFNDPKLRSTISADTEYQDARLSTPLVLLPAFFPRLTLWLRQHSLAPASISGKIPSTLVSDRLGREALAALRAPRSFSSSSPSSSSSPPSPPPSYQPDPLISRLHAHFSTHGPTLAVPSESYILSDSLDHFWAGANTTLDALVPLFHHLGRPENKARQQRLRAELRAFAAEPDALPHSESPDGTTAAAGTVIDAQLRKLKYLDAVIRETLRLNPPIPVGMSRRTPSASSAKAGGSVQVCGHEIPAGMVIGAAPLVLGRNGDVYDRPEEWVPERWLLGESGCEGAEEKGVEREKERLLEMKRCFFAFGAGPRMCLGVNVAWAMMRAVAAGVVGRFELQVVPGEKGRWWEGVPEESVRFRRVDV